MYALIDGFFVQMLCQVVGHCFIRLVARAERLKKLHHA